MKKSIVIIGIFIISITSLFINKANISNERIKTTTSNIEDSSYVPSGYKYVWGDEFNGNTLDTKKWSVQYQGNKLEEPQIYVENGALNLVKYLGGANMIVTTQQDDEPYNSDTNSDIKTAIQYGYIEARVKAPMDNGSWPAFWMKSNANVTDRQEHGWYAETDIMENCTQGCGNGYTNVSFHKWDDPDGISVFRKYTNGTSFKSFKPDPNEWHIYALLWTPEKMTAYYDGQVASELSLKDEDDFTPDADEKHKGMQGFRDPVYFILDQSMKYSPTDTSVLPFDTQFDYVRVYQKDGEGNVYTSPYLTTDSLPEGTLNSNYNAQIKSSGNPTAYNKFTIISGNLPDGLVLNEDGNITGIPTKLGSYKFTVQTENEKIPDQTDSKEYTINIKEKVSSSQDNQSPEVVNVPATSLYGSIVIIILGIVCIMVSVFVMRRITKKEG